MLVFSKEFRTNFIADGNITYNIYKVKSISFREDDVAPRSARPTQLPTNSAYRTHFSYPDSI